MPESICEAKPKKPQPLCVKPDNIPLQLRELPQWVLWKYVWNPNKKNSKGELGDWDKPPFSVHTGKHASSTDPNTWAKFEQVLTAYQEGGWDGIGFVPTSEDGLVILDLDKCRDRATKAIAPWALQIIKEVNSYTEISPSGTGVHIVAVGQRPDRERSRRGPIEIYDGCTKEGKPAGRYLIFTGHCSKKLPVEIRGRQEAISAVYSREINPPKEPSTDKSTSQTKPVNLNDEKLIQHMGKAKNGEKFKKLWAGDTNGYSSQSEADLALCRILASWCDRDADRIDQLFRRSKLYRAKWDREDYRSGTIAKALKGGRSQSRSGAYHADGGRIVHLRATRDGTVEVPLCNFAAKIVEQTTVDDGVEKRLTLAVEGKLADGLPLPRVEVPAADFAGMSWVVPFWGTRAVVYAGTKEHLRVALQLLSEGVSTQTVYAHTGWREISRQWVYLHAGGAIGPKGPVENTHIVLPDALAGFLLPDPSEEVADQVRTSLHVLDLAPDRITVPLLGAVYRSVLASADFAVHVSGPTGAGKTELTALCQQHFGAGLDARHLPGSWASTGNSLEGLAFIAKDALLAVDDFAPHGSPADVARFHREADRLLRAQGNRAGRGRCRPDGSVRPGKPPRGLIVSTGEDVPRGQSLRARLLVLELAPGEMDWQALSAAQHAAATGKLAAAMSGYLRWLAARIGRIRCNLAEKTAALREELRTEGQHARTPSIVADLLIGWRHFLRFAEQCGAITAGEKDALDQRCRAALLAAAAEQAAHVQAAEPAGHFLRLLVGALASGRAYVATTTGDAPEDAGAWGWQLVGADRRPQGRCIGWVDNEDLYLEPEASYAAAQELARDQGESLTVTPQTLRRRLKEKGLLATTDEKRGKLVVRKTAQGIRREVLHFHTDCLSNAIKRAQPAPKCKNPVEIGPVAGPVSSRFPVSGPATGPQTGPQKTAETSENTKKGQLGRLETGIDNGCDENTAYRSKRVRDRERRRARVERALGYGPWLLGVHIGQIEDTTEKAVKNQQTDTGMGIIIPAWSLKALLQDGRSVNRRRDADKQSTARKRRSPVKLEATKKKGEKR